MTRNLYVIIWTFVAAIVLMVLPASASAGTTAYTIKAQCNFRTKPALDADIIRKLDQNETLDILKSKGDWLEVATISGRKGWLHKDMLSTRWIKVHKKERSILLMDGNKVIQSWRMALCPFNPLGDKEYQGDGGTPEGRFFICESIKTPLQAKYGSRSMRLSYPNAEDARRGLKDKKITYEQYKSIILAVRNGNMPSQKTKLGNSLRIHGGGNASDWTLGCVAMSDVDIAELYDTVPRKVRVDVYKSAAQEEQISAADLKNLVLLGVKEQLNNPAIYSDYASGLIPMAYPGGDIKLTDAVCTDVVVRALRNANIDLQALLHEDVLVHPKRYTRWINKPNTNIDHRRTRNLQTWFEHHALVLPKDYAANAKTFKSGDIITMDTGIRNGTELDHVGIVHDTEQDGIPFIFNIWNTGERTSLMALIGNSYPTTVGHFRLGHPYEYH